MNCVELALEQGRERPDALALWLPGWRGQGDTTSFGELLERSRRARHLLRHRGTVAGDTVLVVDGLGPRLYATVLALLSIGASVMLVEPWMPVRRIEWAVATARPSLLVASWQGLLWGLRVPAVRAIRQWLPAAQLDRAPAGDALSAEPVSADTPGIITFTSGTSGRPKGVVRSHGHLLRQHEILSRSLGLDRFTGNDLCIFANFVLANLASGRGSLLIPPGWRRRHLRGLSSLPAALRPQTLTCGPGFLLRLLRQTGIDSLRSIHVGGALTDCWIYEAGFRQWPDADWRSVYGSTEAEPVATDDARLAVRKSRARGCFQTLCLGRPVPEIDAEFAGDGLWVTGPHVCPLYLGDVEENRTLKRRDHRGRVWHCMGDRIEVDDNGTWWYAGRAFQARGDFDAEQRVYARLQSSKSFLQRASDGSAVLVGEGVGSLGSDELRDLGGIGAAVEAKIYRDSRHRARIDRARSLSRGAPWLSG